MALFFQKTQRSFGFFKALFFIVTSGIFFFLGFYFGSSKLPTNNQNSSVLSILKPQNPIENTSIDFQQFWDLWKYTKETYVSSDIDEKKLFYGAMKGMVSGLDDPYSVFFDPEEAKQFASDLNQSFVGIGAEIGMKDGRLLIVSPLVGSPAERAGILPGDWIMSIDGQQTMDVRVDDAVTKIRGEEGTKVVLELQREGMSEWKKVEIVREKIVIDSVKWKWEKDTMIISIRTFNQDSVDLFSKAIQEAKEKNAKGLIVDVRSNPGGLLSSVISIASHWIGYEPVLLEKGRLDPETFNGVLSASIKDIPTVVLVNEGSASASEILAGSLQDYGYAKVVGAKTFGKGSVQDYRDLDDGSSVKVTIAEWYTPKGRSIHKTGIEPDISILFDVQAYQKNKHDSQLETAKTTLLQIQKERGIKK